METNSIIQTAVIGNSDVSRRALLLGLAAASTAAAVAVAPEAHGAEAVTFAIQEENPDLIAAYSVLLSKRAELAAAKDALEWLADEWRHRWPLAPEELLGCANASPRDEGECDIIGRPIKRHHVELTKRLSAKFRARGGESCFAVLSPEEAAKTVEFWTRQKVKGRTPKALERNAAFRGDMIASYKHRAILARQYHAETARLREVSGAEIAKARVKDAEFALYRATEEVSFIPAYTPRGIEMKADALLSSPMGSLLATSLTEKDWVGQLSRFIQSIRKLSAVQA